jgi:competence protein ComEC
MKNKALNGLFIIILVIVVLFYLFLFNKKTFGLKVVFCDVGQGDAALIQFPENEEVLVDTGPNNSVLNCLGKNMAFYDRKISSIFLSHLDSDHIAGVLDVLDNYEVGIIYLTNENKASSVFKKISEKISEKNIQKKLIYKGQRFNYGNYSIETLWPDHSTFSDSLLDSNEYSAVLKLNDGKVNYLFTGDINKKVSDEIVGLEKSKLKSNILKVPHHGSKDFSQSFVLAVDPANSVISVGAKNRYGHPSKETLDFYIENKFKYLRIDQEGDIVIKSDGENWSVK